MLLQMEACSAITQLGTVVGGGWILRRGCLSHWWKQCGREQGQHEWRGCCARGKAKVTITSSSVQGNTAAKGGDGVFIQDTAKVDTSGSSVQANTA